MRTNLTKKSELPKRRVVSSDECLVDLKEELPLLFTAFNSAVEKYEKEVLQTPPESRSRGFEASLLNSKMMQSVQSNFPNKWMNGKYKRFILRVNNYNIFFKKLNGRSMPMNVKTKHSEAINNQLSIPLFDALGGMNNPILYFGYRKDKFGNIFGLQISLY